MTDTRRLNTPRLRPWWSHRWPWLLMLGPAIVILAGLYTGWLAFSQQDALVVGDYYKKGKAINQDLRRDRAATALGVSVTLEYADGMLKGRVTQNAAAARPDRLLLHLAHATQPEKDVRLVVYPSADGSFGMALPALERTRWQVLVENARRDWRLEGSWQWPAKGGVALRADAA